MSKQVSKMSIWVYNLACGHEKSKLTRMPKLLQITQHAISFIFHHRRAVVRFTMQFSATSKLQPNELLFSQKWQKYGSISSTQTCSSHFGLSSVLF
jgi:hypothetical protein